MDKDQAPEAEPTPINPTLRRMIEDAMTATQGPDGQPVKRHPNISGPVMTAETVAAMPEPLRTWSINRIRTAMQGSEEPPEMPFEWVVAQMHKHHVLCDCHESSIVGPHCNRCGEAWPCNGRQFVNFVTSTDYLTLPDPDDNDQLPIYMRRL